MTFLKKLFFIIESLGYARASSELSRMGYVAEAKRLLVEHAKRQATFKELSKLSDKELADIGINRGDIHNIAFGDKNYA